MRRRGADTGSARTTDRAPVATASRPTVIQIFGSIGVIVCVIGGFVLEGGHIMALWHPFEVLIIVGSALGAFFTSNPTKLIKAS